MDSMTWDNLLDEYFFAKILRPDIESSYRKVANTFLVFTGVDNRPAQVTRQQVLAWRRYVLHQRGLKGVTWNSKIAHMRAVFNFAIEGKILPQTENPFNGVVVNANKNKKKTLTQKQLTALYLTMGQFGDGSAMGVPSCLLCIISDLVLADGTGYVALYRDAAKSVVTCPARGY
ncbi:hypothetical protein [Photorhabdus khanii]